MAFLSAMNISASALTAQRMRLDIAAENIANVNTTRTESGQPYRRKMVVFEPIEQSNFQSVLSRTRRLRTADQKGVRVSEIIEDTRDFKMVYNPSHPDADENGYVQMPNVDLLKETVDSMEATRAYDANITAFNAIKSMATKGLDIGK
ncbi:MAG: flagellar basal body rod protein FlgC [Lachnospiraceae bacterium]|nr:flagellar basal body rod protein FlgC [Lachnospiraceae bacterium]